jgi:hypothetical protein
MGSAFGWMAGGFCSPNYLAHGKVTWGELGFAILGAFCLGRFFAVVGMIVAGPAGIFFGALFGSAAGSYLGYMLHYFSLLFILLMIVCW